jgi:hypothetical protein
MQAFNTRRTLARNPHHGSRGAAEPPVAEHGLLETQENHQ